jgi:hypothetical protein
MDDLVDMRLDRTQVTVGQKHFMRELHQCRGFTGEAHACEGVIDDLRKTLAGNHKGRDSDFLGGRGSPTGCG